jgi:hypothetical protein
MFSRRALVIALLVSALPPLTGAEMTKLRIEVRNAADKPVDRASVIVQFVEGRSIVKLGKKIQTRWELKTNQEGVAKIPTIPQGKIRIQVYAKQHQTFGEVFDVNEEEKTLRVKLNPPQPQYSAH